MSSSPPRSRPLLPALLAGGIVLLLLALGLWLVIADPLRKKKDSGGPQPATMKPIREGELNAITLTAEAEKRLDLKLVPIRRQAVPRVRTVGGEVMAIPGRDVIATAPLAGRLQAPLGGVPAIGQKVHKGQPILHLLPLLTPEARTTLAATRIEAEGQLRSAEVEQEAARIALDRARRLLKGDAGSQRAVDEAQARFELAGKAVEAAGNRRDLLSKAVGDFATGVAAPLILTAPDEGILRAVPVREGQLVPSGTTLFEVEHLERVWIRVPVYAGDLTTIALDREGGVDSLGSWAGPARHRAQPVKSAPPSASALAASVDLFYEMDNREGWRTGQRVNVTLPLRGEETSLVAPWAAIQFDVHGGTWVYMRPKDRTYERRRVQVPHVEKDLAVLETTLAEGTEVVISGGAELFGTEVGLGIKAVANPVDDDD